MLLNRAAYRKNAIITSILAAVLIIKFFTIKKENFLFCCTVLSNGFIAHLAGGWLSRNYAQSVWKEALPSGHFEMQLARKQEKEEGRRKKEEKDKRAAHAQRLS
ncbi:hypothetical protein [Plesiomonas shigelloides]|uniref:hypothetical protein n=1 Tax=Plesiomonas shigelloides TaxID=703 RepID=UPI001261F093|nr:hypothetical protein [Plesiomonas shigelloides]KAB7694551.1 hypothetical protein GBN15_14940 [Plesiomonas shigelloides]